MNKKTPGGATQGNGNSNNNGNGNEFLPPEFFNSNGNNKYYQFQDGKNQLRLTAPFYYGKCRWYQDEEGKWHIIRWTMEDSPKNAEYKKSIKKWFGCKVINRVTGEAQLLLCEKATIAEQVRAICNEEGSVIDRDLQVRKAGKDKLTTYSVSAMAPVDLTVEEQTMINAFHVNWDNIYKNENPFIDNEDAEDSDGDKLPWE